jgi:hypothetical protein
VYEKKKEVAICSTSFQHLPTGLYLEAIWDVALFSFNGPSLKNGFR